MHGRKWSVIEKEYCLKDKTFGPKAWTLYHIMIINHIIRYIIIGAISFVTSVVTTIVLGTKFINQPAAHGFFSYSDTKVSHFDQTSNSIK